MWESILTMSVMGLFAGFIFSMPVAGPIGILVTSNALKGRLRYSNMVAIGASLADLVYITVGVYGITKLQRFYQPAMPYILIAGALFLFYIGYRVFRSKLSLEHLDELEPHSGKPIRKDKGGFYTGCMVNFLNPTLIFGWLTTSVLVITFTSSLGLNTGGLDLMINKNVKSLNSTEDRVVENNRMQSYFKPDSLKFLRHQDVREPALRPAWFPLLISIAFALSLSIGSMGWFVLLGLIVSKFRQRINARIVQGIIRGLGIVLCMIGLYFVYTAINIWI